MDGSGGKTVSESREKKIPVLFSHPEARGRSHQGKKIMQWAEHTKEESQEDIKVTY